jgi:hypothetical protein
MAKLLPRGRFGTTSRVVPWEQILTVRQGPAAKNDASDAHRCSLVDLLPRPGNRRRPKAASIPAPALRRSGRAIGNATRRRAQDCRVCRTIFAFDLLSSNP